MKKKGEGLIYLSNNRKEVIEKSDMWNESGAVEMINTVKYELEVS